MARTRISSRARGSLRRPGPLSAVSSIASAVGSRVAPYAGKVARDFAARAIQSWWRNQRKPAGAKRSRSFSIANTVMNSAKRRKTSSSITYRSTGRSGPKFVKPKRASVNKFIKYGSIIKTEYGVVQTDPDCIYIGHSAVAAEKFLHSTFLALVRTILTDLRVNIPSFDHPVAYFKYDIFYQASTNGVIASTGIVTLTSQTGSAIADSIRDTVLGLCATGVYVHLQNIQVSLFEPGVSGANDTYTIYNFADLKFTTVSNSNMQLQNRTIAATGAGDETSALDVSNNPLRGKVYSGWSSTWPYRFNNDTTTNTPTLQFSPAQGVCYLASNLAGFTSSMSAALKKPPPHTNFIRAKRSSYVQLAPGEIKRSHVKHVWSYTLNQMLNKCYLYCQAQNAGTQATAFWGPTNCLLYGLEKLCDTGAGDEPTISVGLEIVQTTFTICRYKKKNYIQPIVVT